MEESISSFLDRLSARSPAPAGGASAALQSAQAAALVAMVARTCGDDAEARAQDLQWRRARALIDEDAVAYAAVIAAEPGHRSAAVLSACEPQVEVGEVAATTIAAADRLAPRVRRRIVPDLVAAVLAARSALHIAAANVRANLGDRQSTEAEACRARVREAETCLPVADRLIADLSGGRGRRLTDTPE